MSYINKLILAREFRNNPTQAENKLWRLINRDKIFGYRFRRQYVMAGYILDFYCPALKLGIEVDGKIHDLRDNINYDIKREHIIKLYNIDIIRLTNKEIEDDILSVLKKLTNYIKNIEKKYYL
ncbi:MAG: endonuclease domain-containing protein [Candidatus Falkowbacteria bacterium]|nr:endonuclease domain-containing protein [Candidatus Falkowbacteria bacterium]